MLILDGISKSFGKHRVLDGVSAEFDRNACTVIVGVNGAGKTTLLNAVAGLSEASSGVISIDGKYLVGSAEYRKRVFYVPSDFYLPDFMTGREYADFVFSRYPGANLAGFQQMAAVFEVEDALGRLVGAYSFGMKKKLQIAIAASLDVDYLIIDEGLTGLDFETTLLTLELLEHLTRRMGIVLVSHDMDTVRRFPNGVFLLKEGHLVAYRGPTEELARFVSEDHDYGKKLGILEEFAHSL